MLAIVYSKNVCFTQNKHTCKSLEEEIISLENIIKEEKNTIRKNIFKSNKYVLIGEQYRLGCPNKAVLQIDTSSITSPVQETRKSRGASESIYSTYSEYLNELSNAQCCKKVDRWDYSYYQYPYEKFKKMRFLKKRINFKKINYPILKAAILYTLNEIRKQHVLQTYYFNYALETAASEHALHMQVYNFFSHTSPIPGRETVGRRALAAGFPYTLISQSIKKQFGIEYDIQHPCEKCGNQLNNQMEFCNKCGTTREVILLFPPDVNGDYFSLEPKGKPIKNYTYIGLAEALVANLLMKKEDREVLLSSEFNHFGVGLRHYNERQYFEMDMFYVVIVAGKN